MGILCYVHKKAEMILLNAVLHVFKKKQLYVLDHIMYTATSLPNSRTTGYSLPTHLAQGHQCVQHQQIKIHHYQVPLCSAGYDTTIIACTLVKAILKGVVQLRKPIFTFPIMGF